MSENPLSLMLQVESEIQRSGADKIYTHTPFERVHKFSLDLERSEPFRTIAEGWLPYPLGGGRTGVGVSGRWVWNSLLRGKRPEEILDAATKTVEENRYEAREVRVVRGIKVTSHHDLTEDAYLCPNSFLPQRWEYEQVFGYSILGKGVFVDSAALIQKVLIEPAILPREKAGEASSIHADSCRNRDCFARQLRLALGLVSGRAVEMPQKYIDCDLDCVFSELIMVSGSLGGVNHIPDREVNVEKSIETMKKLKEMVEPEALELSIDRLLRSRRSQVLEDRIIDLGMAAEIALMHVPNGQGDGKSEITEKLSNRGAWLIGTSYEDRKLISTTLKKLYSARSTVVHTGKALPDVQGKIQKFDELISRIDQSLLDRGRFPDWKELVLGGNRND